MPPHPVAAASPPRAWPSRPARSGARWSRSIALGCLLALTLAALQLAIWYSGVVAGGGLDRYVRRVTDFAPTLTGALLIREGEGARLYDLGAQRAAQARVAPPAGGGNRDMVNIYNHPPAEALAIAPLLALPYWLVFVLWTLASVVAFAAALWLLADTLRLRGPPRLTLLLAACAYHPVHLTLWLGQNSAFVLLGLCGVYRAWMQRRDGWLGVALVLLGLKPQMVPLIVLLLVLQRRWRALITAATSVAILTVAAMPILGPGWPLRYAHYLLNVSSAGAAVAEHPALMHDWRGLLVNLFGTVAPSLVTPLLIALSVATVGVVLGTAQQANRHRARDGHPGVRNELLFACICLATVLISPHVNPHDLTFLIVPACIIVTHVTNGTGNRALARAWIAACWFGWLLPIVALSPNVRDSIPVVADVILIAGAVLALLWRVARTPTMPPVPSRPSISR